MSVLGPCFDVLKSSEITILGFDLVITQIGAKPHGALLSSRTLQALHQR